MNQKVYKFEIYESSGLKERYITEHRNDRNGRGLHFHVAETKIEGQDLFQNGERYKNLGKDPKYPDIFEHYPEDKDGFMEGKN